MNTDVFVCHTDADPVRMAMLSLCVARWAKEPGINLHIENGSGPDFQKQRRVRAENMARSPFYVVADDDCLIQPQPVVARALEIMLKYPTFAILSLWPSNATIQEWTPENYLTVSNEDVAEHVSVGGVRFCRRDIMVGAWPPMRGAGYDMEQCEWLRRKGYRSGYFRTLTMNHLGEGHSSVWR